MESSCQYTVDRTDAAALPRPSADCQSALSTMRALSAARRRTSRSLIAVRLPLMALSGHANRHTKCPLLGGAFNRSVQHQSQSIGRGFEAQGLSRALIEPQRNWVEVGLGEAREIGSSREILSQQ